MELVLCIIAVALAISQMNKFAAAGWFVAFLWVLMYIAKEEK